MSGQNDDPHASTDAHSRSKEILNVRAEVSKDQGRGAAAIDSIGHGLARPALFFSLLGGTAVWVVLNLRAFPGSAPWDPYPFMFLATIASALAPFLTLLVLMYQRRASRIAELRDELDLQVALHLERQISMVLRLLEEAHEHGNVPTRQDRRLLQDLQVELDAKRLMRNVRRELAETSE